MTSTRGFTLVEVLIALAVFAVLSTVSVGILRIATNAQETAEEVAASLGEVERVRTIIRGDLFQIANRPFRESGGLQPVPVFSGGPSAAGLIETKGPDEEILAAFVRRGWANPGAAQKRPSVQQVTYVSRNGALIRRVRPFVDAVKDTPYRDEVLFAGVGQISAEYYGPRGWQTDWRALGINDRPEAFRLVIDHPDLGRITQSFLVGGAP